MTTPEDDRDFVSLLGAHQGAILGYIRSMMGASAEVEDVLQRTNLTLWRKRRDFVPGTNFKSWVFAVARFEVMGERRRLRRRSWLVLSDTLVHHRTEDWLVDRAELDRAWIDLRECLERLCPRDRELIRIRYFSGITLEEYARHIQRSAGTLKTRLHRIRTAMRRCLEDRIPEEDD